MRRNNFLFGLIITVLFVVIQSTLLQKISVYGVVPDIALIMIVFISNSCGAMKGQMLGFIAGLIQDFLSAGPLGFNALVRTVVGFFFGRMKGKLFLDSILLPVLFIIVASLIKEAMTALIGLIFMAESNLIVFGRDFLIELGMNAFLAPFCFALLKLLKIYRYNDKDGY
ncbi:MAG: rod shape-determining protein MreD [Spirochaetales bacterium]|uniref:Rod shape-determining protein MreD n=1 Tax=Candidatus Thalassospirochaeta sargassi TaxID=3119039 RepID=A0AAJ1IDM0_9SPIO|nr:rod shape-determining protein MreD [Spirochaetales bacterium]